MMTKQELGILILAGGSSKRLGCNKAFYELNGKPMIKHVLERIAQLSDEIVISCKLNAKELKKVFPAARLVVDKTSERGPLIGLMSALPEISSDYVAVIACDCPWLSPEVIEFIFLRARGHDGALLRWPNGFIEPLQAVYRTRSLLKAVKRARGKGINKLGDVVNSMEDIVYISPEDLERIDPELKSFRNINSPEDVYKYNR